ncbi:glycosyl transferase family group 2-domain-containing protein [Coprinopsis sp. MPI-PUGE-AT-0042]|nr:glycosyl transferase family group 2-domain-containing protein [Coprinopsis sp. MPI-PUGE-AT-0042]
MEYDSYDAILHYVFRSSQAISDASHTHNRFLAPFEAGIRALNPLVATKVRTAAVHSALSTVSATSDAIYIDQHADSDCGNCRTPQRLTRSNVQHSCLILNEKNADGAAVPTVGATKPLEAVAEKPAPKRKWWSWKLSKKAEPSSSGSSDPEKGETRGERPVRLFAPFYSGLGLGLSIFLVMSGLEILLKEFRLDGDYMRFILMVSFPFLTDTPNCLPHNLVIPVLLPPDHCQSVLLLRTRGPISRNSKYYSAVKPIPNPEVDARLPHITIEMPVYKESLEETITPSVNSLKKAMQTYARQGGTSSIFVHDDGLQLLTKLIVKSGLRSMLITTSDGLRDRPMTTPRWLQACWSIQEGLQYELRSSILVLILSLCMEKHLLALEGSDEKASDPFRPLEEKALELAIEETYEATGRKYKPWACNARSLRVGDVILLIDSDTIVPEDCFRDAARELHECPDVGIIQHESDVMQVPTTTSRTCISIGCANGEVAPFVGHNAFLRWSALQEASFVDPDDGVTKVWSESNVSEDFDMALRLQLKGYIIRWATYSECGFKEGVSLTCDDELNRWQKYAYGCNELIFNPLIRWWRVGPVNKQLRVFLWSNAPVHYKITMMSYMFSYYGLAASFLLSVLNYFMLGLALEVDGFYMHSFEIFLAVTVVFPGLGNVGYTLLEYRLGHKGLLWGFLENMLWVPFFFFFFGGLSIHIAVAILAHMFSYNITWGATKKEVERSNFWKEVPKILKRFKVALVICFLCTVAIAILATPLIPIAWRIDISHWAVIFPLVMAIAGHVLYPIVLNPWLMIFSY